MGVTGDIVGARRPDQVNGWAGTGEVVLDDPTLDEIARAVVETGAGDGPVHPARPVL